MQDHKRFIAAGQSVEIDTQGEFIYCKSSTGDVRVYVGGTYTDMNSGDEKYIPGGFDNIRIENPDPENDSTVVLVVGFGRYNTKVIRGEVTVTPGIRIASGEFVNDDRERYSALMRVVDGDAFTQTAGTIVAGHVEGENGTLSTALIPGLDLHVKFIGYGGKDYVRLSRASTGEDLGQQGVNGMPVKEYTGAYYNPNDDLIYAFTWGSNSQPFTRRCIKINPNTWTCVSDQTGKYQGPDNTKLQSVQDAAYDPVLDRAYLKEYSSGGARICVFSGDGNTLHYYVDGVSNRGITWDSETGYLVTGHLSGADSNVHFVRDTLTTLESVSVVSTNSDILSAPADLWAEKNVVFSAKTGNVLNQESRYFRNVDYAGYLSVDLQAQCAALFKAEKTAVLSDKITVTPQENTGRHIVSGQVIKTALEVLLDGKELPENYLDYVYRFEYFNGARRRVKSSGSISFKAAEIADDFTVVVPDEIAITLRSGILD